MDMDDSLAQPRVHGTQIDLPAWKTIVSSAAGILLGILFIVSGVWKLIEPFEWAEKVVQAKVPAQLGLVTAVGVGITETFGGVLLLVPRFRRWGAWVTGFLLVVFMAYFAWFYKELTGADCSCFPWLKRTVGPGFFIGDGLMLLLAAVAAIWARRADSVRGAAIVLGVVCVFALASLGMTYTQRSGAAAPREITVDGQAYSLRTGRHFIYFFDPECAHCYQAAQAMSAYKWRDTMVIGVPTVNPQFAPGFLKATGLRALLSPDLDLLRKAFPFGDAPFGVAVENGRQTQSFIGFENGEPEASLRKLGFVE
jgi:uncharacterized membrane protein YphA (DoxX/SURF4 family)